MNQRHNTETELEQLIAEGIAPKWARCSDPERIRELLDVMEERELTDGEAQALYEASDGPSPPPEYQIQFLESLNARIDEAEQASQFVAACSLHKPDDGWLAVEMPYLASCPTESPRRSQPLPLIAAMGGSGAGAEAIARYIPVGAVLRRFGLAAHLPWAEWIKVYKVSDTSTPSEARFFGTVLERTSDQSKTTGQLKVVLIAPNGEKNELLLDADDYSGPFEKPRFFSDLSHLMVAVLVKDIPNE